jgi:CheY-like chemotaxis protein
VLVVEDETAVRDVASLLLRRLGCRVTAVENGRQAVEAYRRPGSDVDAVLLDLVTSKMSGPQTYDALRSVDSRVRVLLASGYSREGDAQALLERGARGFIQKPYDRTTLSEALARVPQGDG